MRSDRTLQHLAFGSTGSFWAAAPEGTRNQLRAVCRVSGGGDAARGMVEDADSLSGQRRTWVTDIMVPLVEGEYSYIGPDFEKRVLNEDESSMLVDLDPVLRAPKIGDRRAESPHGIQIPAAAGYMPLYFIPVPPDLHPIVLLSRDRAMCAGVDFFSYRGFIAVMEDPHTLFHDGMVHIARAWKDKPTPYGYSLGADASAFGHRWIAAYDRESRSIDSFLRAAAEASGHWVLQHSDTVLRVETYTKGVRYHMLRAGVVDVEYSHRRLQAGQDYPAGYIVSVAFRDMRGTAGFASIWSTGTLELDGVIAANGLTTDSPLVRLKQFATNPDNLKIHAAFVLDGETSALTNHREQQRLHELETGVYLAETLAMAADEMEVDLCSIIETFYGDSLIMLDCRVMDIDQLTALRKFALREKPASAAVMLLTGDNSDADWRVGTLGSIATSWDALVVDYRGNLMFVVEDRARDGSNGYFIVNPEKSVAISDIELYISPASEIYTGPSGEAYTS